MKVIIDKSILNHWITTFTEADLKALSLANPLIDNPSHEHNQLTLNWSALFAYLNLGNIYKSLPDFETHSIAGNAIISALEQGAPKELLIDLYDQLFAETLAHIKNLEQIQQDFLIHKIQKHKHSRLATPINSFTFVLDHYENALKNDPYNTLHDLILYLAWDRVCVYLAIIFERFTSADSLILSGLDVFIECLLDSFQHITLQGKTAPGFFRLVEALFAYLMREENLQHHLDEEWLILCQGSRGLISREELADLYYIDVALYDSLKFLHDVEAHVKPVKAYTMDAKDRVESAIALAQYMIEKIKVQLPNWPFLLCPIEIHYVREREGKLQVEEVKTY